MIEIPPENNPELIKSIADFNKSFRERSFSGRHLELGKMISCGVCGRRHRKSEVCEQRFAKVRIGHSEEYRQTESVEPKPRRGIGPKKRMNPHFSKRRITLVQRVKEFIEAMPGAEDFAAEVRTLMLQYLKRDWKQKAKIYRDTQKQSRTTNRAIR